MTNAQPLPLFILPDPVAETTPLMAQYLALKAEYADYLLFFRLGDFYELFFHDAVQAAAALDIALTKRGKHLDQDIPMCGVPWHQADTYLARLLRQGFRIAIAEQTESSESAKNKLIARHVVRVLTPGTVTEDNLLNAKAANYLLAIAPSDAAIGLAWADISTGAFFAEMIAPSELPSVLARIEPNEILLPDQGAENLVTMLATVTVKISRQSHRRFDAALGQRYLAELYRVADVAVLGDFTAPVAAAIGALLAYVQTTQNQTHPGWQYPQLLRRQDYVDIDAATARNLELRRKLDGNTTGSLLWAIDRTQTAAGGRLLAAWLAQPLRDLAALQDRYDTVAALVSTNDVRAALRQYLPQQPDIERALARIALDRAGPRDLLALAQGLATAARVRDTLPLGLCSLIDRLIGQLGDHTALIQLLRAAIIDAPPFYTRDGGFIRAGFRPELDHQLQLRDESKRLIAALETRYVQQSGVSQLKIKHNNILGYFIEVPPKAAEKIPAGMFTHKQSLTTAVRYTTPELAELEQKIAQSQTRALALELAIFTELQQAVRAQTAVIQNCATALAQIDVVAGLAELAVVENYVRPELVREPVFVITGGRHPVVEQIARAKGQQFVTNDSALNDAARLWLLTGPNMAGKSTFLRQNALIAILAQIGSFVPASAATIGIVDKIFSRVGAADDLARGQSTFMVEMVETATILHQATAQSLVILDEIGRGTATHDGLAIAWAVVEYLHHHVQCRALFATHYHELTALADSLPRIANYRLLVREWQNDIVFLHQVGPGIAERSYGLHVARLAGLPAPVIARAKDLLTAFENGNGPKMPVATAPALPIDPWREKLRALDVNNLSPRQAWEVLAALRDQADD